MSEKNLKNHQNLTKNTSVAAAEKQLENRKKGEDFTEAFQEIISEGAEGAAPRTDYAKEERDEYGRTVSDDDDYFQESLGQSQRTGRDVIDRLQEEDLDDDELDDDEEEELEDDNLQDS